MAETLVKVRYMHAIKTAAEWISIDPVLLYGEVGYESDTGKSKVGDGGSKWSELLYTGKDKVDKVPGKGLSENDFTAAYKSKIDSTNLAYGTCSTAAATAAKVITLVGNAGWKLAAGSRITIKFTYTNTAQNPTFNVNSTGAKSVWYNTGVLTTANLSYAGYAKRPMDFVYDGTQFVFTGWSIDSNTTYSAMTASEATTGTATTGRIITAKVLHDKITEMLPDPYNLPAAGSALGGVKTGGDVTISSGVITVNDDSHNHVISNVDGLQAALDDKETAGAAATALNSAKFYTDTKVADLINGAPTTLDTLKEIADAMAENADVVEALDDAIGTKAPSNHNHVISNVDGLQTALDGKLSLTGGYLTGTLGVKGKYEIGSCHNYTNGCLIDLNVNTTNGMYTIHITGNSYNGEKIPVNSIYQFYNFASQNTIAGYSGIELGSPLGDMKVYHYNGRVYAWFKQPNIYQTLQVTLLASVSNLTPTITNAAAHTADYTNLKTITPETISTPDKLKRLFSPLIPMGTTIPANANLNTTTYLKVGNYSCGSGQTLTNRPPTMTASVFTMEVSSPASTTIDNETTSAYVFRLRKIKDYDGNEYIQKCQSDATVNNWTYGSWRKILKDNDSVTSATKLATARNISLSGAVTTSAPKAFDGSQDINIDIALLKEAYLTWGGRNHNSSYGPLDAAMISRLGADRLAFGNPTGVSVEYSTDGGTTWLDYSATETEKRALFSSGGVGLGLVIGKNTTVSSSIQLKNYLLRVTIDTDAFGVYTVLNKFAIYASTNGSSGSYCSIDAALESTPTTFVNFADKVRIGGWPGWNIINTNNITTYGNNTSVQYGKLRFTFGCTDGTAASAKGLQVLNIMGFGGVGWNIPSNMAKHGHLYSWDVSQNATFPAAVKASEYYRDGVQISRLFSPLVPHGTTISENVDLNTVDYLKVGTYSCRTSVIAATLTNCPTSSAFMMQVISPTSTTIDNENVTNTSVYRVRKILDLNGDEYKQYVRKANGSSTYTYSGWKKITTDADLVFQMPKVYHAHTDTSAYTTTNTNVEALALTVPKANLPAKYEALIWGYINGRAQVAAQEKATGAGTLKVLVGTTEKVNQEKLFYTVHQTSSSNQNNMGTTTGMGYSYHLTGGTSGSDLKATLNYYLYNTSDGGQMQFKSGGIMILIIPTA